jgi:hypothetical protein
MIGWIINWKRFLRMWYCSNLGITLAVALEGLGKAKETSVRLAGFPTQTLSNQSASEYKSTVASILCCSVLHCFRFIWDTRPPLWSSGQSSWLQIQRSRVRFRNYHIFWEVVCPKRGHLSLMSSIAELLGRESSGSCLENREYGRRDPLCWPHNILYPPKLALTSPKIGGCSVGIVRSLTVTHFYLPKISDAQGVAPSFHRHVNIKSVNEDGDTVTK